MGFTSLPRSPALPRGVIRLVSKRTRLYEQQYSDLPGDQFELLIFTGLEVWLIIFCGSIPTLAPLWDAVFGRDRKNTDYYSSNGSSKLSESSGEEVFQSRTNHNPYFSRFTEKNIVVSQTLDIESSSKRTIV